MTVRLSASLARCGCGLLLLAAWAAAQARPPNLILIMADDLGYGGLGCYGSKLYATPRLDRMAKEGLRFTDFHSNGAVCSPTRAALLTGRYQQRTGVDGVLNADPKHPYHQRGLHQDEVTFAEVLGASGYRSAVIGKWHLGYRPRFNPVHQGFGRFVGFLSGNVDYQSHYDRMVTFDWWHGEERKREPGYVTELLTKHALSFMDAGAGPFCLYVSHAAVHNPNQGPDDPPIRGPDARPRKELAPTAQAVKAMMTALDQSVGAILDGVASRGLSRNTLVLFISDNGGTRENKTTGPLLRGLKGSVFEGGHRVPAIAWWPGRIKPGVTAAPAMTMDLLPTFASLAGAPIPEGHALDGVDLKPLLLEQTAPAKRRLYWQNQNGKAAAVRDGPWKLVVRPRGSALFNLAEDLKERRDLSAEHPRRVKDLTAALDQWRAAVTR